MAEASPALAGEVTTKDDSADSDSIRTGALEYDETRLIRKGKESALPLP
jgi:hypothetical protein